MAGFARIRGLCSTCAPCEVLRFCVVGSGPAGFYTAEKLLKRFEDCRVDLIERLPTPFGLVRSGVAPDHPETKLVINKFSQVASDPRCQFYGNVSLGSDVTLEQLRGAYNIVVLAYGAESDNKLGIDGEALDGVHSAREFVWWYNGHPDGRDLPVDLRRTETAVVLGQGNVALDVSRILLRPVEELATTDISEHALDALRTSNIRRVYVVGRRGPVQAACTTSELREILGLNGVDVYIREADLTLSPHDEGELKVSRIHKRAYELFCQGAQRKPLGAEKELHFVFLRAPNSFLAMEDGKCVKGIRLEKTRLEGKTVSGQQKAVGTGEFEDLQCGLVLKSIGYRCVPVPGLQFDHKNGFIPNILGRVLNEDGSPDRGLYVAGWLKRGPTGIIGTNLHCANEVVESIQEDVKNSRVPHCPDASSSGGIASILQGRNKRIVSFEAWQRLDEEEVNRGLPKGKPREKIVSVEEASAAALG